MEWIFNYRECEAAAALVQEGVHASLTEQAGEYGSVHSVEASCVETPSSRKRRSRDDLRSRNRRSDSSFHIAIEGSVSTKTANDVHEDMEGGHSDTAAFHPDNLHSVMESTVTATVAEVADHPDVSFDVKIPDEGLKLETETETTETKAERKGKVSIWRGFSVLFYRRIG